MELIVVSVVALVAVTGCVVLGWRLISTEERVRKQQDKVVADVLATIGALRAEYEETYARLLDRQMARTLPELKRAETLPERIVDHHERAMAQIQAEAVRPREEPSEIIGLETGGI